MSISEHNSIRIWLIDMQIPASLLEKYRAVIPADERRELDRIRNSKKQQESLVTRAVLRLLLARLTGTEATKLRFATLAHGKPVLIDQATPCHFNISHSNGYAAIAVTRDEPVGIDLQWHRSSLDQLAFSQRFFHPDETAMLQTCPSEIEQTRSFYSLWTGKEALFKADGRGIAVADLQTSLCGIQNGPLEITLGQTAYCVQLLPDQEAFSWAIASRGPCREFHWQYWQHPEA